MKLLSSRAVLPIALAGAGAVSCPVRAVASEPSVAEAAAAVIRDLDLQTKLPQATTPYHLPLPSVVLWAGIALLLAFLLYSMRDYIPLLRRRLAPPTEAELLAAGTGLGAGRVGIADALAAERRFMEAMHELLLEAIARIRALRGDRLADSLTSREVMNRAELSEAGTAALRGMIGQVELTYFGEYPAVQSDYLDCRQKFELLCTALDGARPR
jgi:hypothetical protein